MELPEILVQEVLLRLPPAEPASFLRAAAVCKRWHDLIFARSFVVRLHEFHHIDSAFAWARGEEMEEGEQEAAAAVTTPPTLRRSQRLARMSAATTPAPVHRSAQKAVEMTPPTLRRSQRLSARKGAATLPPTLATLPSLQEAAESMILVSGPRRSVYRTSKKQIEEPTSQCTMKSNEYSMASFSVYYANLELVRLKKELHQKSAEVDRLDEALGRESDQRRNVSQRYENDKKLWAAAITNMEKKIKAVKEKQALLSLEAHECANAIPDLSKMIGAVEALVAQCEDLKWKYCEEMDKRKKLHNILLEIKGNIRVFCRCRPLSKHEVSSGMKCVVNFDGANDGDILITNTGRAKKTFKFDRVFTPKHDQDVVYADVSPLVTSVLDGYNLCIFAYGQTGTGKTFTMEGTESNRGVNYRAMEELFKIAEAQKESVTYEFSVNILEVYNEQIRDLSTSPPKKLEIKQDREGATFVPGLVEAKVNNIKEVWDFLQAGSKARTVGSNNINEHSSRSHCMLFIMVRAKNLVNGECTSSKLCLVDLAGSERLAKTDVQGERLKEAQNINKSLAALGNVISALSTKSSHIPYRNSKLTHLLQDSLGGDSKMLMFVQISPSDNDVSETVSSLKFASDVCRIELGLAKKQVDTAEFQKTKQMVKELKITLEKQHHQFSGKLKEKEEMCADLEQKVTELKCKLKTQQSDSEVAVLNRTARELEHEPLETQRMAATLQVKLQELESNTKVRVCRKRKATEPPVKNLGRSTAASRATAAATRMAAPDSTAPAPRQQPGGNKTRAWVK